MSKAKVVDYYAVLGVPRDATADHIRSEWRKLQPRYHPDSYTLWQLNAAAEVLLNTAKRAEHDESLRETDQRNAPPPRDLGADSLDFSHAEPAEPSTPAPTPSSVVPPRKTTESGDRDKASGSRKIAVPVLIVIAIAVVVAFAMTERASKEPVTPGAKATSPTPQSPKPPQTYPPPPKVQTPPPKAATPPPQAPTLPSVDTRAIPAEFLKKFQEYATKSGGKAIALALDSDGRWAYGSVSGFAKQPDASEEALSDCARFKAEARIRENCRLFAVGDKLVW